MIDGIINIYKEQDFTSRDAVSKLCGIIHQKKAGHTGTLDPMAEGVLPVCLGSATKLVDMFTDTTKQYRTVIKLGAATDTEDITGHTTMSSCYDDEWYDELFDSGKFEDTVKGFIGDYSQVPPMYSAKKVNGKKLYEIARAGLVIEREPCLVHIYDIAIDSIDRFRREATLTVTCGKGTYIRTLCHDIGEKLGCFACMKELIRTKTGIFTIENAYKLSCVEDAVKAGRLNELVVPVDAVFEGSRKLRVTNEEDEKHLLNGGLIKYSKDMAYESRDTDPAIDEKFLMYDSNCRFVALYRFDKKEHLLKAEKMFLPRS